MSCAQSLLLIELIALLVATKNVLLLSLLTIYELINDDVFDSNVISFTVWLTRFFDKLIFHHKVAISLSHFANTF
jgi:hypothetical protein